MKTFLWYDIETFGLNPKYDRLAQFAAIRTDMDMNVIEEPVLLYARLSPDYLPSPESCLITGITPQEANSKGMPEAELIARVRDLFMVPDTIVRELELKGMLFRALLTGMEVRIEYPEGVSDDEILQFIQREEKKYGLSRAGVTYSIEDGYAIITFPENFTTRKISQWISIWMDDARVFVRDL